MSNWIHKFRLGKKNDIRKRLQMGSNREDRFYSDKNRNHAGLPPPLIAIPLVFVFGFQENTWADSLEAILFV